MRGGVAQAVNLEGGMLAWVAEVDPTLVVELLGGALLGVWLQSQAGRDYGIGRMARMWQVLLPTAAVADSLEYFREFLARETQRLLATPAG